MIDLSFLNFSDRIEKVRQILVKYNFDRIDERSSSGRRTYIENLRAFGKQLISDGIEKDEIDVMIEILEGTHPLSGSPRNTSNKYNMSPKHGNWKIHLYVIPKNQKDVYYWLFEHCTYGWKYLSGGEEGKTFTIYIGSWDECERFANILIQALGNKVSNPHGDILSTDLQVYQKIWGRFHAYFKEFSQYGSHGLQYLWSDTSSIMASSVRIKRLKQGRFELDLMEAQALKTSYNLLNQSYGAHFRGTKNQVGQRIFLWIKHIEDRRLPPPNF